ncbi:unnamed protein product [Lathyrus oleraceus]
MTTEMKVKSGKGEIMVARQVIVLWRPMETSWHGGLTGCQVQSFFLFFTFDSSYVTCEHVACYDDVVVIRKWISLCKMILCL